MERHKAKVNEIKSIVENEEGRLNVKRLRELVSNGCPNESGVRSLVWKILLNYLPHERSRWKEALTRHRNEYREFVREMIIRPGIKGEDEEPEECIDHPLNSAPTSQWSSYFKDNETLVQIDKDVRRLCPGLSFFQLASEFPCVEIRNASAANSERYQSLRKRVAKTQLVADQVVRNHLGLTNFKTDPKKREDNTEYSYLPDGQEAHWEVIQRILFIYAKLNAGDKYVQGMNEVCAPIYYIFANDPDIEWRKHAEADCFFCFNNLMGLEGVRDNFSVDLDKTQVGITSNMKKLYDMVKLNDEQVYQVLDKQNLKPEFFAFRWITLLLSQDFKLPDVITLWDGLFCDSKPFDLLLHVCCAMIFSIKTMLQ